MKSTQTPNLAAFTEPSLTLQFGAEEITITELSVGQVIALAEHADSIAQLDFSDIAALFTQHSGQMIELLSIALAVPKERVLTAKASQLTQALAAIISLNKEFFLQAVQTVVQGAVLKATVQAQVSAAVRLTQQSTGPMPSPPSSPAATASATSSATLGADTPPTVPPPIATPKQEPASSSSSPE